jgi:hypothetical protein
MGSMHKVNLRIGICIALSNFYHKIIFKDIDIFKHQQNKHSNRCIVLHYVVQDQWNYVMHSCTVYILTNY